VKAVKSKAQERLEIESQIKYFLHHGGKVESVKPGVSGWDNGSANRAAQKFSSTSSQARKEDRTPLLEQIRAIEARRNPLAASKSPKRKCPHRVLIKDDFGEPLRWSWRDT
jgi:hypothetical protein